MRQRPFYARPHFGYVPNPEATARFVGSLKWPCLSDALPNLGIVEGKDTFLWEPLIHINPSWRRGAQEIGDCVSWGAELACTMLMAMQHVQGEGEWIAEGATEAIYGLRAETGGRSWEDGWYGSGAAEALQKYGVCLRIDYSEETGNREHDLRRYSGERAKQWGYYGCGGEDDNGKLDAIAKKHPVKGVTQIRTVDEFVAAIQRGCPITIASGAGFKRLTRDENGVQGIYGTWMHQMMIGGVKWINGKPHGRIFNSHGSNVRGPDPGINHDGVSGCSWWCPPDDLDRIFSENDSYAFSSVDGFDIPLWDWSHFFT